MFAPEFGRCRAGEYVVTWRQALTTPAWETTFTVSIGAEGTENDVAPGFAVAGLVADTHKSYVQVCPCAAPLNLQLRGQSRLYLCQFCWLTALWNAF